MMVGIRPLDRLAPLAAALGAGVLVAAALPPWGWWPLAFVGVAGLDRLLAGQPAGRRALAGLVFGLGWLTPGMGWMWQLTIPGYVAATLAYGGYVAAACAVTPPGRWRRLALPAALTLTEALRFSFPFGGVPLASLAIAEVAGPLAPIARIGGPLLLTWATLGIGMALSAAVDRRWREAVPAAGAVAGLVVLGLVVPDGRTVGELRIALVQGGGPQGTRASTTNERLVFERHLNATRTIPGDVDLVVWPENVINVDDFATSVERSEVVAEAERLGVPFAVGVTEDVAGDRFVNAQVVLLPDGSAASRYEKVRRVPFGEYVPLRGLLEALGAPVDQIPRDAVAGTGPAVLDGAGTRLGVAISWEVFFGGRGRDAIANGGTVLLNPTNGASYTGTIVQTQQVASSRLRAWETGRWVAQVSPTGFSAFVSPSGDVHDRTSVSEQAVLVRTIELREGRTPYVRLGDAPVIAAAAVVLVVALALTRRDDRRAAEAVTAPAAP